jgi:hypothetical protein
VPVVWALPFFYYSFNCLWNVVGSPWLQQAIKRSCNWVRHA